jgi:hypothetical protein
MTHRWGLASLCGHGNAFLITPAFTRSYAFCPPDRTTSPSTGSRQRKGQSSASYARPISYLHRLPRKEPAELNTSKRTRRPAP